MVETQDVVQLEAGDHGLDNKGGGVGSDRSDLGGLGSTHGFVAVVVVGIGDEGVGEVTCVGEKVQP